MQNIEEKQKRKKMSNGWKITTHKNRKISGPVLIEGLPGIGNVGKVVADYLIEKLEAERLMSFFSHDLPNSVFVNEENLVELPKIEIYHKKIAGRDFLFLAGDVQPTNEKGSYNFVEFILSMANKWKCKEIVTLGGIGLAEIPDSPKVYCTGNDKKFVQKFVSKGAKQEVYGLVGPIIGVSGLLVGMSTQRKIKAAAILAETYGHPMYLGLKGAKESLRLLTKTFDMKISFRDLNKEIKLMEREERGEDMDSRSSSIQKLKKHKETNYIG